METKIKLANATAIVAIVFGAFGAIAGIILASFSGAIARTVWCGNNHCGWGMSVWDRAVPRDNGAFIGMLTFGLLLVLFSAIQILFAVILLKKSGKLREDAHACNDELWALIAFSFFVGGLPVFIMCICTLCIKGSAESEVNTSQSFTPSMRGDLQATSSNHMTTMVSNTRIETSKIKEFEETVSRFKQYKTDGIVTEEAYNKKVKELSKNLVSEIVSRIAEE